MYSEGHEVKRDYSKAVELYKKSYEFGNSSAFYNLRILYEEGRGVKQDNSKAMKCYQKASELGKSSSLMKLSNFQNMK